MSPLAFMILLLFIILGAVLYLFGLQTPAIISFFLGLLTFLFDKIPKSNISIKIERVNKNIHKIIIQNSSSFRLSDIRYEFCGRLRIDDLPTKLEAHQIVEFPIGLSVETKTKLGVEVSWRSQFGLSRSHKHITTEAIG